MSELKVGLWFFFSAHHLIMPYICTKFPEEIFNYSHFFSKNISVYAIFSDQSFKVTEWTQNITGNKKKGHN